jgi:hypothetical protein
MLFVTAIICSCKETAISPTECFMIKLDIVHHRILKDSLTDTEDIDTLAGKMSELIDWWAVSDS